jgi:hypothetical protein
MFKSNKIVTVGKISEFLNPVTEAPTMADEIVSRSFFPFSALPFVLTPAFFDGFAAPTFAAGEAVETMGKAEVSAKIMSGFDPIIDLVSGLAYPIAFISLSYAGILYMLKRPEDALDKVKHTALGFVLVQMAPLLMKLLISVTAGF